MNRNLSIVIMPGVVLCTLAAIAGTCDFNLTERIIYNGLTPVDCELGDRVVNGISTVQQMREHAFSVDGEVLRWNFFMPGRSDVGDSTLSVKTDYPWSGRVELVFGRVDGKAPAKLKIRIPGWAQGVLLPGNVYLQDEPADPREVKIAVNGKNAKPFSRTMAMSC